MLVYYVLLLIIILGIYFEYNEKTFVIKGREYQAKTIFFWIIYIYIMILGLFRKPGFGVDYSSYDVIFRGKSTASIFNLLKDIKSDNGFFIWGWLVAKVINDFHVFKLLTFSLTFSLLSYVVYTRSKNVSLSYLVYLGFGFLGFDFCIMRQSIAVILCFYAFQFIEKKDWKKYFLFILIAMTFHKTAIVFLPLYPLINNKFKIKPWIMKGTILVLAIVSAKYLLPIILKLYTNDYSDIVKTAQGSKLLILYAFLIFSMYILKRKVNNRSIDILYHCTFGTIVFQAIAPYFSELTRLTKYFSILYLILIPNILYLYKQEQEKQKAVKPFKLKCSLLTVLFSLFFLLLQVYMFIVNAELIYPYNFVFDPNKDYWVEYDEGWKYEDGIKDYQNQFKEIQGEKYYIDENGYRTTGWKTIKDDLYYFDKDGKMAKDEYVEGTYIDENGVPTNLPKKHWVEENGHKKYLASGNLYLDYLTGVHKIDGDFYYFSGDGKMLTGLRHLGNDTYYFCEDGKALIGKRKVNGDSYIFDLKGKAFKGNDYGYVYGFDGKLVKNGFADTIHGTYYTDKKGKAIKGKWLTIDGDKYYTDPDTGLVMKNTVYDKHFFDKDGKSRRLKKDQFLETKDGKLYYTVSKGVITSKFYDIDGDTYYFDENGIMLTGWQEIKHKWYYFDEDGVLAKDQQVDGWYVDKKGKRKQKIDKK